MDKKRKKRRKPRRNVRLVTIKSYSSFTIPERNMGFQMEMCFPMPIPTE